MAVTTSAMAKAVLLNHIRNFGEWNRTHGQFGAPLENPPETNEVLEMVKKFEKFAA